MPNIKPIIIATDLSVGYHDRLIWKNASFIIGRGEFVGILGPNGAGKTTLFRLLLGLVQPISGQINLFDNNPKRGNPRIGYVPQRRSIDSDNTIEALELVRLGINGQKWGFTGEVRARTERQKALKALTDVGGENLAHRSLGTLSGGELQRIFLAQALVGDVDILLLDEPLANLDVRRAASLVKTISHVVKSRGVTVLLIAHDLNPLLPVIERVMYVANGRIATGRTDEVITSKSLSDLYGAPIEVLRDSRGRVAVLGTEEAAHHD